MKFLLFAFSVAVAAVGSVSSDFSGEHLIQSSSRLTDSNTLLISAIFNKNPDSKAAAATNQRQSKTAPDVIIPKAVLTESAVPQLTVPEYWPVTPDFTPPVVTSELIFPEVVLPSPGVSAFTLRGGIQPKSVAREVIPASAVKLAVPAAQVDGGYLNDDYGAGYERNKGSGVYATLQSWFDGLLNFVNNGVRYTHQFI